LNRSPVVHIHRLSDMHTDTNVDMDTNHNKDIDIGMCANTDTARTTAKSTGTRLNHFPLKKRERET